jgi:hypothetical protein
MAPKIVCFVKFSCDKSWWEDSFCLLLALSGRRGRGTQLELRGRRRKGTLLEKKRKEKEGRTVRKGEEGEGGTHC